MSGVGAAVVPGVSLEPPVVDPDSRTVAGLRRFLAKRLVGQPEAAARVAEAYAFARSGLRDPGKPLCSMLMLGPTGVGKTLAVELLAEWLEAKPVKVDCGEFQHAHEVAKLVGSPPGYLGHRETQARLTQMALTAVMSPWADMTVLLFDEAEKAHDDLFRLLLGVLDKGEMRLGDNQLVTFHKCLIFFTSNLGAAEMARQAEPYGFEPCAGAGGSAAKRAVEKRLAPELINRLDYTVTFRALGMDTMSRILSLEFEKLRERAKARGVHLTLSQEAHRLLAAEGYSAKYGAREMARTLMERVGKPLAERLTDQGLPWGTHARAVVRRGRVVLT